MVQENKVQLESRVIVITSGKGGVGKTTAVANIGISVARLGYRVRVQDRVALAA